MINLRIYRAALLLIPIAGLIAMFSLQSVPEPLRPPLAPDAFDGGRAAALARQLASRSDPPRPGSDADEEIASLVADRFTAIEGAEVSEQEFDGEFEGGEVHLRNVILVLPGRSDRQVVLMAQRDAAEGSGAATGLASTASMLEIASSFGGSTHDKTLVFVSTDGDSLGAEGARRFADDYSAVGLVDAVIVLSQPAARNPSRPLMIPWSSGPQSTSIELAETASARITDEVGLSAGGPSFLADLFRLAIPAGLGDQAPLIERGIDAVRISSSGERPLNPAEDDPDDVSTHSVGRFGRAALSLMLAMDAAPDPLEHGPDAYVGLAGNLLPGWALGLLALALIAPVAIAALEWFGRAARRPEHAARAVAWVIGRALPFVAVLMLAYLLALFGLIPHPEFPFDPGRFDVGLGARIALAILLVGFVAVVVLMRAFRPPPVAASEAAGPAALIVATAAVVGVWLANPYLALLLAPALHAWMVVAMPSVELGTLRSAGVILAGLVPVAGAIAFLAGRLEVGTEVVWDLLLMVTGAQISFPFALLGCVLAGCAFALVALARARVVPERPEISVRGPEPEA